MGRGAGLPTGRAAWGLGSTAASLPGAGEALSPRSRLQSRPEEPPASGAVGRDRVSGPEHSPPPSLVPLGPGSLSHPGSSNRLPWGRGKGLFSVACWFGFVL